MTTTDKKNLQTEFDFSSIEEKLTPKKPRSHHELIKVRNLNKSYRIGSEEVPILENINLTFYSGEFVVVYGLSGCGKSTFLHTILGLEKPTSSNVLLRDVDLYALDVDVRASYHREKIGMVFQQSNWIKSLNVIDNISYPLLLSGVSESEVRHKVLEMLTMIGVESHSHKRPMELSGANSKGWLWLGRLLPIRGLLWQMNQPAT